MKNSFSLTSIGALPVSPSGYHGVFHSKQQEERLSLKWQQIVILPKRRRMISKKNGDH